MFVHTEISGLLYENYPHIEGVIAEQVDLEPITNISEFKKVFNPTNVEIPDEAWDYIEILSTDDDITAMLDFCGESGSILPLDDINTIITVKEILGDNEVGWDLFMLLLETNLITDDLITTAKSVTSGQYSFSHKIVAENYDELVKEMFSHFNPEFNDYHLNISYQQWLDDHLVNMNGDIYEYKGKYMYLDINS